MYGEHVFLDTCFSWEIKGMIRQGLPQIGFTAGFQITACIFF